jgi:hypothetical protein
VAILQFLVLLLAFAKTANVLINVLDLIRKYFLFLYCTKQIVWSLGLLCLCLLRNEGLFANKFSQAGFTSEILYGCFNLQSIAAVSIVVTFLNCHASPKYFCD